MATTPTPTKSPEGGAAGETTLRVALAMGGGVSLGAFSGAALTEALKILLLYGKDRQGKPYKDLKVDVFSGASAGSMCLLVMLRYLAHSPVEWHLVENAWKRRDELKAPPPPAAPTSEEGVIAKLKKWIGINSLPTVVPRRISDQEVVDRAIRGLYTTLPDAVVEDLYPSTSDSTESYAQRRDKFLKLVALQVLQDKQEDIWTSIRLEDLIKGGSGGGILNQDQLKLVTKKHLQTFPFSDGVSQQQSSTYNRFILSDRVAFASTLTSLTASQFDSRGAFNVSEAFQPATADGLTSLSHRTQRVFDLFFTPIPDKKALEEFSKTREEHYASSGEEQKLAGTRREIDTILSYPMCWVRAQPNKEDMAAFDVNSKKLWAMMAATSLASGAFPIAFPPIPLVRYWWEFGAEKCRKWNDNTGYPHYQQKEFLFVDGGLLDNEPLRQAYRMASVFDSKTLLEYGDDE